MLLMQIPGVDQWRLIHPLLSRRLLAAQFEISTHSGSIVNLLITITICIIMIIVRIVPCSSVSRQLKIGYSSNLVHDKESNLNMASYSYTTIDVFAERPLEGNPVAIFESAEGLSEKQMLAIAGEMNLSETTFIFPERDSAATPVRIFTKEKEVPFAGHPVIGTAFVLAHANDQSEVVLRLKSGEVKINFESRQCKRNFGEMTQNDPVFGEIHNPGQIAHLLAIQQSWLDEQWPIQTVSTGTPFIIIPLRSLKAAQNLSLDWPAVADFLEKAQARSFYFLCGETVSPEAQYHARMLVLNREDPATGSAAGDAIAWLVKQGAVEPGRQIVIEQGTEMNRPSLIFARASVENGRVCQVRIAGKCVQVMRGKLNL
jgi:trans-2,3-dihydro-3-hydroxyanthranilate isomerase